VKVGAHTIKGGAANLYSEPMRCYAYELEKVGTKGMNGKRKKESEREELTVHLILPPSTMSFYHNIV